MKHPVDDDAAAAPAHVGEEYGMPCAEALLAGALTLMTGHAQACCDGHRENMAKKIVESLFLLSQHPTLSPEFKTLVWNLHTRWVQQVQALADLSAVHEPRPQEAPAPEALNFDDLRVLWHTTHETIQ